MTSRPIARIVERQKRRERDRRELVGLASPALSAAKQAIFKLQRQDKKGAAADLSRAKKELRKGADICKRDPGLLHEGVWRAAQEEYSEAIFFYDFLVHGKIGVSPLPTDDPEILIGGLADFTGELARYAVVKATEGDAETVDALYAISTEVVETLVKLDLTGSLRSKFDQTKQHVRKLEDIRYDLSRRGV